MYNETSEKQSPLLYLWNLRTLYIGELSALPHLTQGASSLFVGIEGDIEFRQAGITDPIRTRVALVPADVTFSVESFGNNIVNLFLDPVLRDFELLKTIMLHQAGDLFYGVASEDAIIAQFQTIFRYNVPPSDAYRILREHVFPFPVPASFCHDVDSRIWDVINIMKQHPLENFGSEHLAEKVGMSDVQLRRLFKRTTGLPLRRYRRWHRLFVTATLMAFGKSLTDAAISAGFSDSSHFNHTFREMLGMKPSFILRNVAHMRIHYGLEDGY